MKVIYFSRNKAKSSWLHLPHESTQSMFKQVADSLQALNRSAHDVCLRDCFLPAALSLRMTNFISDKITLSIERRNRPQVLLSATPKEL